MSDVLQLIIASCLTDHRTTLSVEAPSWSLFSHCSLLRLQLGLVDESKDAHIPARPPMTPSTPDSSGTVTDTLTRIHAEYTYIGFCILRCYHGHEG